MKKLFPLIVLLVPSLLFGQDSHNFSFDNQRGGDPDGWDRWNDSGQYTLTLDSTHAHDGQYAALITSGDSSNAYAAWRYDITPNFEASTIKLSGWIKGENVSGGHAGIWLRLDPQLGFDNMRNEGLSGTFDWQYVEVELPYKTEATNISFGSLLVGSGKVWVDGLSLTLDGLPLAEVPARKLLPAQLDSAFSEGSGVTFPELTSDVVENLELLGKVWGFLKYHHPTIAEGQVNWDYELFRLLPEYLKVASADERDALLVNWIVGLGPVATLENLFQDIEEGAVIPDHDWWLTGTFSPKLQELIQSIFDNRTQGAQYYYQVSYSYSEFLNESPYSEFPYPDAGMRLVALYRYWNMVHYFFPNRNITDTDWDEVLGMYVQEFVEASSEFEYELAMAHLIAEINDTHGWLAGGFDKYNEFIGERTPPVRVNMVEDQAVVVRLFDSPYASEQPLRVGDVITHVEGVSVEELLSDRRHLYRVSNENGFLWYFASELLNTSKDKLALTFRREGASQEIAVATYPKGDEVLNRRSGGVALHEEPLTILEGNIGFVSWSQLKDEDIPRIIDELKDTKAIIFDNRYYPSMWTPFTLAPFFLESKTEFVSVTKPVIGTPGLFQEVPPVELTPLEETYGGKVIALVNSNTLSSAEYQTMALQASPNTTVLGSQTAGADGNVVKMVLPGGLSTYFSGIGVLYPDATDTQRTGLKIDVEVHPTVEGIRAGRDELLERAIQLIEEGE